MYTKYNYQIIHINGGRNAQLLSHVMEYETKRNKTRIDHGRFYSTIINV